MKKGITKIHKSNPLYTLIKISNKIGFYLFYKRIEVRGKNNIPYGNPLIFTPNHQNALMDALAVLFTCGLNLVFMARADIFRKKRQAKILNFLKILPIYRMRDGTEELSKNAQIFDLAQAVLADTKPICLMPEGNHGEQRRLRSLVKGSFRIAFNAQEKFGDRMDVKIIPVGLEYEHYQNFHQNLLINYGKAIEVKEFMDIYLQNPPKAINQLKERLSDDLKKVMIHIENEEYYNIYQELRLIYNKRMRNRLGILENNLYQCFVADKEMIRILDENLSLNPEIMNTLKNQVSEYAEGVKNLNLRYWVIDRKGYRPLKILFSVLLLIIASPLFLFGWLNNIIPYTLPQRMIRKVKDPQFHSSIKFGISFFIFPLYYSIIAVSISLFTGFVWLPWLYIAAGITTGYIALYYSFWFKKLKSALKYRKLISQSDPKLLRMVFLHESIISKMNDMVEDSQKRYLPQNNKVKNVS